MRNHGGQQTVGKYFKVLKDKTRNTEFYIKQKYPWVMKAK